MDSFYVAHFHASRTDISTRPLTEPDSPAGSAFPTPHRSMVMDPYPYCVNYRTGMSSRWIFPDPPQVNHPIATTSQSASVCKRLPRYPLNFYGLADDWGAERLHDKFLSTRRNP
ncbi:hypothetical protein [Pasteuria penetrans]|uniref:hypothetical protein n=1 Tax=Pasteuria penetrans TaxID=86005 RepID=UPI000FA26C61|nr:hypothetical protein [Pasteuria penetrans]